MGFKEWITDNAPKLLIFGGVAGLIGSGVGACIQTRKLDKTLEIRRCKINAMQEREVKPTKREIFKEKTITCLKVAGLYAIPAAVAGASTFCICKGTGIMDKRLEKATEKIFGLTAAYGALSADYTGYRNEVKARYGEEVDEDIHKHHVEREVTEKDEAGNETTKTVKVSDTKPYGIWYYTPKETPNATKSMPYALLALQGLEGSLNLKMRNCGMIWKNNVLQDLGFPLEEDGWTIGKIFDRTALRDDDQFTLNIKETYYIDDDTGELIKCYSIEPNFDGEIISKAIELGLIKAGRSIR